MSSIGYIYGNTNPAGTATYPVESPTSAPTQSSIFPGNTTNPSITQPAGNATNSETDDKSSDTSENTNKKGKNSKGTPLGLAKKGGTPPGLAKKGGMPPGQAKKAQNQTKS